MDDSTVGSLLSEASSVDSQDTNIASNVTKLDSTSGADSPTDVRGFHDDTLPHLGSTSLPIVREGTVLNDSECGLSDDSNDDDGEVDAFEAYQREQEEFNREMNQTKIAFTAYRNAVLHLVHHQAASMDKKVEKDGHGHGHGDGHDNDDDDDDDEEDANLRMIKLEETAKNMVEAKAKACFDAVFVANEFKERREERTYGRVGLFSELLKNRGTSTTGGGIHRDEVPTLSPASTPSSSPSRSSVSSASIPIQPESDVEEESTPPVPAKKIVVEKNIPTKKVPKRNNTAKSKTSNNTGTQSYVKRRKPGRHPDCILGTLPKFVFQDDTPNDKKNVVSDEEPTPARYGTTKWIGNMVKWRAQWGTYKMDTLKKCGCPDCEKDLKKLMETKSISSS